MNDLDSSCLLADVKVGYVHLVQCERRWYHAWTFVLNTWSDEIDAE